MNLNAYYELQVAGYIYYLKLRYPQTSQFFHNLKKIDWIPEKYIMVTEDDFLYWYSIGNQPSAQGEYSLLSIKVSDELLKKNKCIFHAVAFICRGMAWLLCADPGVGKSTQYKNLKELYGDDIKIICGDRPVLEIKSRIIYVHPSPWNGKEGWCGENSAPLAGIFFLKQGHDNYINDDIDLKTTILRVYSSIFQSFKCYKNVNNSGRMCEDIIKRTRFTELVNRGDIASSRLLYETIMKEMKDHEEI